MLSLIHAVSGRPWAIRAEVAEHIRGLVTRDGIAGLRHLSELRAALAPKAARSGSGTRGNGATVGVVPVIGPMTQRGGLDMATCEEFRSTAAVAAEVAALAAEPKIDAIVLEVDSGGGEVFGGPEAFTAIREANKIKPVVASVNSVSASLAYYITSGAQEIIVTPSGQVGSIGVFALHVDLSQWLEKEGERWEFVVATDSPFKVEYAPVGPMTDDARQALQADVDRYMTMMVRDIAKGRGVGVETVRSDFGRGRMVGATEAVAKKMADSVGTLDMAIRRAADLGRERRAANALKANPPAADAAVVVPSAEEEPIAPPDPTPAHVEDGRKVATLLGTL